MVHSRQIIGIVSAGDGNCGSGSPDVFTKVSNFLPYIKYELNYDFKKKKDPYGPAKAVNVDELKAAPSTQDFYRYQPQYELLWPPRGAYYPSYFF